MSPSRSNSSRDADNPRLYAVTAYKSARLDSIPPPATVTDAPEDDAAEAGPSAALPTDFFDTTAEDEEGGRFFGGGVNQKQAEILDFMDSHGDASDQAAEKIDIPWLRKKALSLEKKISKNAEMRGKFEDEPHRFMQSEEELDVEIKSLSILSQHPELFEEFARLGSLGSLVRLLAHENTDIAVDVVEIVAELTDDGVEAEPEEWSALVDGMVEGGLLEVLVQNLERLNEGTEGDRNGVYHTLSVIENLASQQKLVEQTAEETGIFPWLLKRIQVRESPLSQNKQYSAEVLAILLQTSQKNRKQITGLDAVDVFLQLLSPYRNRNPVKGGDEEEFVENVFDCLTCVVDESEGKGKFVEAEGVELTLIMLKQGKMSKSRALRLLDHAVSSVREPLVAMRVVEAAGLKILFFMFMKKQDAATTEHLVGIFASMLRLLPAESAERIRTLAKFVENDYSKIAHLLDIRNEYALRLGKVEMDIRTQKEGLDEDEWEEMGEEWLSRRLDAGLFGIQMTDLILAWLCAEDDGAKRKIAGLLEEKDFGTEVIHRTLQGGFSFWESDLCVKLTGVTESIELMGEELDEDQKETREMLMALLQFV
jgi:beta-catenin-like protein 1